MLTAQPYSGLLLPLPLAVLLAAAAAAVCWLARKPAVVGLLPSAWEEFWEQFPSFRRPKRPSLVRFRWVSIMHGDVIIIVP